MTNENADPSTLKAPEPVSVTKFRELLATVFDRYREGIVREQLADLLDHIEQVRARWNWLSSQPDEQSLQALFSDLKHRREEVVDSEQLLFRALDTHQVAQRTHDITYAEWQKATLTEKVALSSRLPERSQELSTAIQDVQNTLQRLLSALNYQGDAFDMSVDWRARMTASEFAVLTPEPSVQATLADAVSVQQGERRASAATKPTMSEPMPEAIKAGRPTDGDDVKAVSLFWRLINAGELSLAHAVATCFTHARICPENVMEVLVLGTSLVNAQGEIANELATSIRGFISSPLPDEEIAEATNLLLVAATLRSGLLAAGTGASDFLRHQVKVRGLPALSRLISITSQTAQDINGAVLNPASFRQRLQPQRSQQERNQMISDVRRWLDSQSMAKFAYQPATAVWHKWVDDRGHLGRLLAPILHEDALMDAKWAALLADLSTPAVVERWVQDTDREQRDSRHGAINYSALEQIRRRSAEAVAFARQWQAWAPADAHTDYATFHIVKFKEVLDADRQAVLDEITALYIAHDGDESHPVAIAAKCLSREIYALYDIFVGSSATANVELEPRFALHGGLLVLPGIHLDDIDFPEQDTVVVRKALLAYEPGSSTIQGALQLKLKEADFSAAQRLWRRLPDSQREDFYEQLDLAREHIRQDLSQQHTIRVADLDRAFRNGLVSSSERDDISAKLSDVENAIQQSPRLDRAKAILDCLQERLAAVSRGRIENLRSQLQTLSLAPDSEHRLAVERLLLSNDVLAADEYVDHLRRGQTPPNSYPPREHFKRFLKYARHSENLGNVTDALSKWKSNQDYFTLSAEIVEISQRMVEAWMAVKRLLRSQAAGGTLGDLSPVINLLFQLGFQTSASGDPIRNRRDWHGLDLTVRTMALADRESCPLPEFGSDAHGQYRLLVIAKERFDLNDTQMLGVSTSAHPATFIFVLGTLTQEQRLDIYSHGLKQSRSYLVLDEQAIVYLASLNVGRLPALFDITAPFSVTNPYKVRQSASVPPEMFFGRASAREQIIAPHGAAFVFGGRRLGKTVLLKEIQRQLHSPSDGQIVHWVDLPGHGIGRNARPEELWTVLVREMERFKLQLLTWPTFRHNNMAHVRQFCEALRAWIEDAPTRRILFLLDEADEFLKEDAQSDYAVTRQLKNLMETTEGRFKVVFVGLHNVLRSTNAPNHPLVHLQSVEIGPLYADGESRYAFEMIRRPFNALGFEFAEDGLIMRILGACNYYPNLINLFCRKLLERMRQRQRAPSSVAADLPRQVTSRMISDVYELDAVRDEIRHVFTLTLQLDTRYELVAYYMAREYLERRMQQANGLEVLAIYTAVSGAWPEGFKGSSLQEFSSLLQEMVGLGVLRRLHDTYYTFRSPNVLQLMGSAAHVNERIEAIQREGELSPGFDRTTFRGHMSTDGHSHSRSPFTFAQEEQLFAQSNGMATVIGSEALGLSEVINVGRHRHTVSQVHECISTDLSQLEVELNDFRQHAKNGLNLFVLTTSLAWNRDWYATCVRVLGHSKAEQKFVRAVAIVDPARLLQLAREDLWLELSASLIITLKPWSAGYLRIWLEDTSLPADLATRKLLMSATNGYPYLLYELAGRLRDVSHPQPVFEEFATELKTPLHARAILLSLGITDESIANDLYELSTLNGSSLSSIEDIWPEISTSSVPLHQLVRWAELLELVQPSGTPECWEVAPFVTQLLTVIRTQSA